MPLQREPQPLDSKLERLEERRDTQRELLELRAERPELLVPLVEGRKEVPLEPLDTRVVPEVVVDSLVRSKDMEDHFARFPKYNILLAGSLLPSASASIAFQLLPDDSIQMDTLILCFALLCYGFPRFPQLLWSKLLPSITQLNQLNYDNLFD